MDPLLLVLIVAGAASAFCWIASLVTKDTSWVDRLWSIVPVGYVWIFAIAGLLVAPGATTVSAGTEPDWIVGGADSSRLLLMAVLVTAWGARLTFNFARKGGYTGMEDYRWAILRGRMSPAQFQAFNLLFIVLYQNALLVLITLPAYVAFLHPAPLGVWDGVFAVLFIGFLVGEFVADQQQWDFHQAKKAAGGTLAPGFLATGMFAYSRHPNFFFEQAQWWALYALGATAAVASGLGFWGGAVNGTIAGPVLLSILFVGSTIFTESITASKYPGYDAYRRTTPMIVPLPRRRRTAAA